MKTLLTILLTLSLSISIVNTAHAFTCDFFNHPNSCARAWCLSGCWAPQKEKCRQGCYSDNPVADDWDNVMLRIKGTIGMPTHPQDKEARSLTTEIRGVDNPPTYFQENICYEAISVKDDRKEPLWCNCNNLYGPPTGPIFFNNELGVEGCYAVRF